MPSFILKLGSLDISSYVRVGDGEGLDPYDAGGFEEPGFVDSPFADGEALANVNVMNREQVFPLYLNAASKTALHTLQQSINREIRYGTTRTMEWRDTGAAASTFYDIEYARFEPAFSLRKSDKGWLAGNLRVWSRGYGHTGTSRIAGTAAAASLPALAFTSLPSIAGDASADMTVIVQPPGGGATQSLTGGLQQFTFAALVPSGHPVFIHPASAIASGALGSVIADPAAIASQARIFNTQGTGGISVPLTVPNPLSDAYAGPQRLLALLSIGSYGFFSFTPMFHQAGVELVRRNANASVMFAPGDAYTGTYPLVAATSTNYTLLDLGVVNPFPSGAASGAAKFDINLRFQNNYATPPLLKLGGFILLPDQQTRVFRDSFSNGGTLALAPTGAKMLYGALDPAVSVDEKIVGGPLRVSPNTTSRLAVLRIQTQNHARGVGATEVRVTERFTFAR